LIALSLDFVVIYLSLSGHEPVEPDFPLPSPLLMQSPMACTYSLSDSQLFLSFRLSRARTLWPTGVIDQCAVGEVPKNTPVAQASEV